MFKPLVVEYAENSDRLADFYEGHFQDDGALVDAAERAARHPRDRSVVVSVLQEQNSAIGEPDENTAANIDKLGQPDSVAIVTGQQLGLFGGPLYTLYKTITAIQLAQRVSELAGRPAVPVFWLEGEDHDYDEISHVGFFKGNTPFQVTLEAEKTGGPVGRLTVGQGVEGVLQELEELLPPTEFRDDLLSTLRRSYAPGHTHRRAFASWMRLLFAGTGLVFVSPDDARLKALAVPLFEGEIRDYKGSLAVLSAQSERLAGPFHVQVTPQPVNLFTIENGGRCAIDPAADGFAIRGTGVVRTAEHLLDQLRADPTAFSPNVAFRPLMQDLLLPTAAYVAGPGEIAYFAQFRTLYQHVGIPMPVVYPRASVLLVENKVQKVLDRYELSPTDLAGDRERLFKRLALESSDVDIAGGFDAASASVNEAVNALKSLAGSVESTLEKSAESLRAGLAKEIGRFRGRVVKAEKRAHEQIDLQLQKAQANLFPDNAPQERFLSPLYFLNKYGPGFVGQLFDQLSLDTSEHQIISV